MTSSCWIRLRSRDFASMFFGRVASSGSRMPAAATDPRQPEMVLPTTGILQDENGKVGMCAFITFPVSFSRLMSVVVFTSMYIHVYVLPVCD